MHPWKKIRRNHQSQILSYGYDGRTALAKAVLFLFISPWIRLKRLQQDFQKNWPIYFTIFSILEYEVSMYTQY